MNIPFVQDATFTGLISTQNYKSAEEWAQAYTLLQSNSAIWDSTQVRLWGTITGNISNQSDLWVYLSADSDNQTLTWVPALNRLLISNGNSVSLSSLNTTFAENSAKYEGTFTTIQTNSASWEESATIIPTVTAYLSTNNVLISSSRISNNLTVNGTISTASISVKNINLPGNSATATGSSPTNQYIQIRIGNNVKYVQLVDVLGAGDYTVTFEDGSKVSYSSGDVVLNGLTWNLNEALIGTEPTEVITGLKSARLRGYSTSSLTMLTDKLDGIGTITLNHRRYASDTQVTWVVEYSINGGSTWIEAGTFTAGPAIGVFTATINNPSNGRIRIRTNATGSSTRRTNIDDISITGFIV